MTSVVGAISAPYLPLLSLWLDQSARHMPSRPRIVALDDIAQRALTDDDRIVVRRGEGASLLGDRQSFWAIRLNEILRLAASHGEIVQSDADAFWLASPMEEFAAIDADMIFTRDHSTPKSVAKAWGFTLCCGFYLVRHRLELTELLDEWLERTARVRDDQIAFNEIVFRSSSGWVSGTDDILYTDFPVGSATVRIAVLPYERYSRRPPYAAPGALIAHPFFERRFFASYLRLYRQLFDEFGDLGAWQADLSKAMGTDAPVRDVATFQLLDRQLGISADQPSLVAHRGTLHLRFENVLAAQHDLERARSMGDRSPATLLGLAEIYLGQGRYAECRKLFRILAEEDAETPVVREALELCWRHRRFGEAIELAAAQMGRFGLPLLWRNSKAWLRKRFG